MDVIARLPDCDGQAADAVSTYTQVKMEDAPRMLRIPKSECPDFWIHGPTLKIQWFLFERKLYGHPLASVLWRDNFHMFCWDWDGKSTELGMLVCSSKTGIIPLGVREWHQNGWKEAENGLTCGRKTEQALLMNTEKLNHEFSAGVTENLQVRRKHLTQARLRGATIWKHMLKNALRYTVNWRTTRQNSYTKSQVLAWMIDWVCSMTQILLATFRIQNQLREESCVSLEVEHSFLPVRCAGKKRQYPTVSTESEIISFGILDYEWMDYLLSTSGMWSLKWLRSSKSTESPTHGAAGNCSRDHKSKPQIKGKPRYWAIVACGLRHHRRSFFSMRVSQLRIFEDTKQWSHG